MPVPLLFAAVLSKLAENGLNTIADAVMEKGKQVVEDKLGVKLPEKPEEVTPEVVAELTKLQMKHEEFLISDAAQGQEEVTKRWQFDMLSDSRLSKNVRPLTLIYWTVAITVLILLDSFDFGFKVKQPWIDLIEMSYGLVLGAYFVGRTIQHGVAVYNIRRANETK